MAILILQPGAATGIDSYTFAGIPAGTHEIEPAFVFQTQATINKYKNGLLKFDLSLLVGTTIIAATLYLYSDNTGGNSPVRIYRIKAANDGWIEACNWNYAIPSSQRWAGDVGNNGGTDAGCSVSGTDFEATHIASFSYVKGVDTEHVIALNTAQFQTMVDGANYGFVILGAATFDLGAFRSSDYGTPAKRPKLVVDYVVPLVPSSGASTVKTAISLSI